MSLSTKILDHLIHLTPPGTVPEASEQFRKLGFTVLPGGTHTGGLTANALVILSDSVYLELISFTHSPSFYPEGSPERKARDSNVWASKAPGWIDYSFLGNGSLVPGQRTSDTINDRAGHHLHAHESPGGRQRPDGKVLEWVLSVARDDARGTLPFFCGDVTPREWRVSPDPSHANHPSTTQGISYVRILTSPQKVEKTIRDLTSVIGDPPSISSHGEATWTLDTGHPQENRPSLILSTPADAEETEFIAQSGTGIHEVGFRVRNGKSGTQKTPYGKIRWVPDN